MRRSKGEIREKVASDHFHIGFRLGLAVDDEAQVANRRANIEASAEKGVAYLGAVPDGTWVGVGGTVFTWRDLAITKLLAGFDSGVAERRTIEKYHPRWKEAK